MKLSDQMPAIQKLVDGFSGRIAFSVLDEYANERIDYNEDVVMPTASTMKVFCLAKILQMVDEGSVTLDEKLELNEQNSVRGSGVLKELQLGLKLTVQDACMLMIIVSDNAATNMVIDRIGGIEEVNRFLAAYGFEKLKVNNRLDFAKIAEASDLAVATTAEFLRFLKLVKDSDMLSEQMKAKYFEILSHQQCVDQFPRYMPYNQYALDVGQPLEMQVYNKTGFMVGVRADVGYFEKDGRTAVYAIMADNCEDLGFEAENEGTVCLGKIGKLVYEAVMS